MEMEKNVYQGKFIRVTEENIHGAIYERAYFLDGVTIIPIHSDGKIFFVHENRPHEKPASRWKLVTGIYEHADSLEENANRELQEEIGLKAASITPYFHVRTTGTLNTFQHIVIARNLTPSKIPNPDGEDSIMEIKKLSLDEAMDKILTGEFPTSVQTLGIYRLHHDVQSGKIKL